MRTNRHFSQLLPFEFRRPLAESEAFTVAVGVNEANGLAAGGNKNEGPGNI
jgi:hypothetical protein